MRTVSVFNQISLDGYFTTPTGDISWMHREPPDPEVQAWVEGNARSGGTLVFGRKTYEMMASFWPTPMAAQQMPVVAKHMNEATKIVFSRSLAKADWRNTRVERDLDRIRELKAGEGEPLVIMGSGSIVAALTRMGLIDEYQFLVFPLVLGAGRTMFEGLDGKVDLELSKSRIFRDGRVYLAYARA
jgi:dihydrofolate reductase